MLIIKNQPHPVSPENIWRDPKVAELHLDERHKQMGLQASGEPFNLRTASQMLTAVEDVRKTAVPSIKTPICAVHGTEDKAVPIASLHFIDEHVQSEHKCIKAAEGSYHDLLGDPDAEEILEFMITFMEECISKK